MGQPEIRQTEKQMLYDSAYEVPGPECRTVIARDLGTGHRVQGSKLLFTGAEFISGSMKRFQA